MHLPVVAEGVETEGQREILKALGCRVMQGFLLGGPRRRRNPGFGLGGVIIWVACKPRPHGFLMSGNTLGTLFTVTNFGESTGRPLVALSTAAPGLELDAADIQRELDRRRPGTSRHVTQRQEADQVEILSGVYEGVTTGTPIGLLIRNTDARSRITPISPTPSAPATPTTPTGASSACAIRAAAGVRRRG